MPAEQQRRIPATALTGVVTILIGTGTLAGCGSTASQTPPPIGANVLQMQSASPMTSTQRAPFRPGTAAQGSPRVHAPAAQRARLPAGSSNDEPTTGVKQLDPCTLVSLAEAQTMSGGTITGRRAAPLGPTCIYKVGGARGNITLAVESMSYAEVTQQMTHKNHLLVRGREAYCGRLGAQTQMLIVALTGGRVLSVTAPCAIAQRLAGTAMRRLTA